MEKNKIVEKLTELAYSTYCKEVGGIAFNGDKLPTWKQFTNDANKEKQANAWRKAVWEVLNNLE